MQKIINAPNEVVEDMLGGFLHAHSDIVAPTENKRVLRAIHSPVKGKVGIVIGGGSGHKPAFIGYVGKNMADAVAIGEVFSSPTAQSFFDAYKVADGGAGVACLYGNYAGDNMNVNMAIRLAEKANIQVKKVVANDDAASAPKNERENRRGVAGEIFMWKAASAKASKGASLDEVIAVAQKTIDNTRSVGIGLTPCTIPAVGHPNFTIESGKMELGIGHHGEPGVKVMELKTAGEIAKLMVDIVASDFPLKRGDETFVLVSGLGSTPLMEQYIVYNEIAQLLQAEGIAVYKSLVGNFFTSLDMAGVTLTVVRVDEELKELLNMECRSVGWTQF